MSKVEELYQYLKKRYGLPKGQWSLWCRRPKTVQEREEVMIEAILTQRTNWKNVEKAVGNLRGKNILRLRDILHLNISKIAPLIRPAGFFLSKAIYLHGLASFVLQKYSGLRKMRSVPTDVLREELLALKGIGKETADSILLYALDRPVFVIDEYTRRLVKRHNLWHKFSYDFLQQQFEKALRKDFRLYQDFHALCVIDGKNANNKMYGARN